MPGRRRVDRRFHRRPAPPRRPRGRRGRRRLRPAGLAAADRRAGAAARPHQRPHADPGRDRRAGRADRRRPVLHLADPGAARADRLRGAGCRPGADGQAAVRGRPGAARRRRRGPRSRPSGRRGGRGGSGCCVYWGGVWPVWSPPRCPDRAAMWSSSCICRQDAPTDDAGVWCAAGRPIADAVEKGAAMTDRRMLLVAHTGRPDIAITAGAAAHRLHEAGHRTGRRWPGRAANSTSRSSTPGTPTTGRSRWCWRSAVTAPCCGPPNTPGRCSAPVLGINLGRVGFLTEVDLDQLDEALDAVVDQRYRVSSRMTVEVTVEHDGARGRGRLGAQRDQRREGHPGKDSRRRRRGRRARRLRLRLRRRAVRDPDRVHRLHLLGRRAGAVAGGRRAAGRAVQRARAVRPSAGGRHRSRR